MKHLLLLALVALVFFFWQAKRRGDLSKRPAAPPRRQTALKTTDMVECAVCRIHLPRNEALELRQLSYCSEAHRQEAERTTKGSKQETSR